MAEAVSPLEVYRYIGCEATEVSETASTGRLRWRPDLSIDGQPSMAALAVLVQLMAGVNVFPITPMVVPTSVTVHLRGRIDGNDELNGSSEVVRAGRTSAITRAVIATSSAPDRPIASATATWAFPGGPGAERGPLPTTSHTTYEHDYRASVVDWLAPEVINDRLTIVDVRPAIAEPVALGGTESRTMHAGPLQILNEAAARRHVATATGTTDALLLDTTTHFLAAARGVPLTAVATLVGNDGTDADVRVDLLTDERRLVAFTEARFRLRNGETR
ncbi:MAG: hypothetical protein AB7L13_15510 [Acidimicrobiia bacterium]